MEALTFTLDPKTLKGIVIGIVCTLVIVVIIYKLAFSIGGERRYRYDDYSSRGRSYHRRQDKGLHALMLLIVAGFLLAAVFHSNDEIDNTESSIAGIEQHTSSIESTFGDTFPRTEVPPETQRNRPPNEYQFEPDSDIRFVSTAKKSTDNEYTTTQVHYVQVAALSPSALNDMDEVLHSYQRKYSSYSVSLALATEGGSYPVKVLVGSFMSETKARNTAKLLQKNYKHIIADQLELLQGENQRLIY